MSRVLSGTISVNLGEAGWIPEQFVEELCPPHAVAGDVLFGCLAQCPSEGIDEESYGEGDHTKRCGKSIQQPHNEVVPIFLNYNEIHGKLSQKEETICTQEHYQHNSLPFLLAPVSPDLWEAISEAGQEKNYGKN